MATLRTDAIEQRHEFLRDMPRENHSHWQPRWIEIALRGRPPSFPLLFFWTLFVQPAAVAEYLYILEREQEFG